MAEDDDNRSQYSSYSTYSAGSWDGGGGGSVYSNSSTADSFAMGFAMRQGMGLDGVVVQNAIMMDVGDSSSVASGSSHSNKKKKPVSISGGNNESKQPSSVVPTPETSSQVSSSSKMTMIGSVTNVARPSLSLHHAKEDHVTVGIQLQPSSSSGYRTSGLSTATSNKEATVRRPVTIADARSRLRSVRDQSQLPSQRPQNQQPQPHSQQPQQQDQQQSSHLLSFIDSPVEDSTSSVNFCQQQNQQQESQQTTTDDSNGVIDISKPSSRMQAAAVLLMDLESNNDDDDWNRIMDVQNSSQPSIESVASSLAGTTTTTSSSQRKNTLRTTSISSFRKNSFNNQSNQTPVTMWEKEMSSKVTIQNRNLVNLNAGYLEKVDDDDDHDRFMDEVPFDYNVNDDDNADGSTLSTMANQLNKRKRIKISKRKQRVKPKRRRQHIRWLYYVLIAAAVLGVTVTIGVISRMFVEKESSTGDVDGNYAFGNSSLNESIAEIPNASTSSTPSPIPFTARPPAQGSAAQPAAYPPGCFTSRERLKAAVVAYMMNRSKYTPVAREMAGQLTSAKWDVSNAVDMSDMFRGATRFSGTGLNRWDVSKVTSMKQMFHGAHTFNQNLSRWNVSRVEDFEGMFEDAREMNGDVSLWDTRNAKNMKRMFRGAYSFDGDLGRWNLSNVEQMQEMFAGAISFRGGDLSSWDVSKVKCMEGLFFDALSFQGIIYPWNVSSVTKMSQLFQGASKFDSVISEWDVRNVDDMSFMFAFASNFNTPVNTWDTRSLQYADAMFQNATKFDQELASWDVTSLKVADMMFLHAESFNRPLASWNLSSVEKIGAMFGGASTFNQDLCPWGMKIPGGSDRFHLLQSDHVEAQHTAVFEGTSCSETGNPIFLIDPVGPFCHKCY